MELNANTFPAFNQAVNASFMQGLSFATEPYEPIAMRVPSMTAANLYPYLKEIGSIREWLGDRVEQNLSKGEFQVYNKDFEQTQSVSRNAVLDDQYGIYANLFEQMGRNVANFPSKLCYSLLKQGFTTLGPDGQFFFDTDHPVGLPNAEVSVSNFMGGAGAPWFVVDDTQVVKPLIWQPRQDFKLVTLFNPNDANVFWQKKLVWGVDGRAQAAFGPFWQLAFASKQTIDEANVTALLTAMASQKNDAGEPLGVRGKVFIGGPAEAETARKLFGMQYLANGASNTLYGRLKVIESPWLL